MILPVCISRGCWGIFRNRLSAPRILIEGFTEVCNCFSYSPAAVSKVVSYLERYCAPGKNLTIADGSAWLSRQHCQGIIEISEK